MSKTDKKTSPSLPLSFGEWVVVKSLGRGGMGEAFLVARRFGSRLKLAALKTPHNPQHDAMFRDEGSLLCSLDHPNIVRGIDSGKLRNGQLFLVMEYVDGASLNALHKLCAQQKQLLPAEVVAYVGLSVANALDYCHHLYDCEDDEGLLRPVHLAAVHRDCTLVNIFVDRHGHVFLGDFGIAVYRGREGAHTQVGVKGNEQYLPPEYARLSHTLKNEPSLTREQEAEITEQLDALCKTPSYDVYLLGETLYRLLYGQAPYADETARRNGVRRPMKPGVPDALAALLAEMLDENPEARPTAAEVARRLGEAAPNSALSQTKLAAFVQQHQAQGHLATDSPTCPAEYSTVPSHRRAYVLLREEAMRALAEFDGANTQVRLKDERTSSDLDTTAPTTGRRPKRPPASVDERDYENEAWAPPSPAQAKPSRARRPIATAAVVVAAMLLGGWAALSQGVARKQPSQLVPVPSPSLPSNAGKTTLALPKNDTDSLARAGLAAQPIQPQTQAAQPPTPAERVNVVVAEPTKKPDTSLERSKERHHVPEGDAPVAPICDLLVLDTVDFSNDATIDGRRARRLALPGQSSLPVGIGTHVIEIKRRNGIQRLRHTVNDKTDCKVQF